jgi:glycyl-tRNA synthetase alpha subunit
MGEIATRKPTQEQDHRKPKTKARKRHREMQLLQNHTLCHLPKLHMALGWTHTFSIMLARGAISACQHLNLKFCTVRMLNQLDARQKILQNILTTM